MDFYIKKYALKLFFTKKHSCLRARFYTRADDLGVKSCAYSGVYSAAGMKARRRKKSAARRAIAEGETREYSAGSASAAEGRGKSDEESLAGETNAEPM